MHRGSGILPSPRKNLLAGSVARLPATDGLVPRGGAVTGRWGVSLLQTSIRCRVGRSERCLARSNRFRAEFKTPRTVHSVRPTVYVWVKVSLLSWGGQMLQTPRRRCVRDFFAASLHRQAHIPTSEDETAHTNASRDISLRRTPPPRKALQAQ